MPKKFIITIIIIINLFMGQLAVPETNAENAGADAYVKVSSLHLRQLPTTASAILLTMKAQTPLIVIARNIDSSWLLVEIPEGYRGWTYRAYVYVYINLNTVETITNPEPVPFPDLSASMNDSSPVGGRGIYLHGQQMGNRRNVFTTVGDSLTDTTQFLRQIASGYNLRDYGYLLPTLQFFNVETGYGNAYNRRSFSAHAGWSSFSVLDPNSADSSFCQGGELPIYCEYRLVKPSVALIMIGTNDAPAFSTEQYRANLIRIIEISSEQGVVPVLSTLPPRAQFNRKIVAYNAVIRQLSRDYNVPLWDFYNVARYLPNRGFGDDGIHLSLPANAPVSTMDFTAKNLRYGATMRNLTALQTLKSVLETVMY